MVDKQQLKVMEKQNKQADKDNRLTLDYFIKNKTNILESKKDKLETIKIKLKRLDNLELIAVVPDFSLIEDIDEMEEEAAQRYILYNCIIEPNIKAEELHKAYGLNATNREKIVDNLFTKIEMRTMATKLVTRSEVFSVEVVDDIKKQ